MDLHQLCPNPSARGRILTYLSAILEREDGEACLGFCCVTAGWLGAPGQR